MQMMGMPVKAVVVVEADDGCHVTEERVGVRVATCHHPNSVLTGEGREWMDGGSALFPLCQDWRTAHLLGVPGTALHG